MKIRNNVQNKSKRMLIIICLLFVLIFILNIFSHFNLNNKPNENITVFTISENENSMPETRTSADAFTRNNGNGNISLAFFYELGCDCTDHAMMVLGHIEDKYPNVQQFWYNISNVNNHIKMINFSEAYNVPNTNRSDTPFIFIGDYYLYYFGIQNDSISEIIDSYLGTDVPLWPAWELTWTMHIAFFYDSSNAATAAIQNNVETLNTTWNQNESHLIIHKYLLDEPTDKLLFDAYFIEFNLSKNTQFNDPAEIFAGVFIGDDFLLNEDIIYDSLNSTVTKYSGRNTGLKDISPDISGGKICVVIFYNPNCGECSMARKILVDMKAKYPDLNVIEYSTGDQDNDILKHTYFDHYKVPTRKRGTLGVFIGDKYFLNVNSLDNGIEDQIQRYKDGVECPDLEPNKEIVKDTFNTFTILAVMGAGLVDSINPCAIATLIFFIGYLFITGRTKKQILVIGMAYTLGIFITYTALGLGFYYLIATSSNRIVMFARLLYPVMAIILYLCGFYSLYDFNKARKGKKEEMKLQLPKPVKSLIGRVIKHNVKLRYFTLIAILTGVVISLLEFLCTGQVYLPTIVLVVQTVPEFQAEAIGLLLLYNLMFVLPLIFIFTAVYRGMGSEQLMKALDENRALIKLIFAFVFFCFGTWMLFYSFAYF